MRKLYIICFVTLTTLFITCYCIGYYAIVKGRRDVEPARDYYEVRQVGAADEAVVKRDTEIVVEEYDINAHTTESYTIVPTIDILGLNRNAYSERVRRYMENPGDEDLQRGISSITVLEFSSERIVIRKSYDVPTYSTTENFILYALDGRVVVYYEDFVTIYDYTDIDITDLPIDLQR